MEKGRVRREGIGLTYLFHSFGGGFPSLRLSVAAVLERVSVKTARAGTSLSWLVAWGGLEALGESRVCSDCVKWVALVVSDVRWGLIFSLENFFLGQSMKFWKLCAGLVVGLLFGGTAQAGLVFTVKEVGPNIEITVAGSIDTTGWSLQGVAASNPYVRQDSIAAGIGPQQRVDGTVQAVSGGATTTAVFPSMAWSFNQPMAGTAKGDLIQFGQSGYGQWILYLPAGYVSNTPVSGSAVYANLSYASLGMVPTQVFGTWYLDGVLGSDAKSVTVQATPEPTSMAMWGIGAAAATWVRRRRRLAQRSC